MTADNAHAREISRHAKAIHRAAAVISRRQLVDRLADDVGHALLKMADLMIILSCHYASTPPQSRRPPRKLDINHAMPANERSVVEGAPGDNLVFKDS